MGQQRLGIAGVARAERDPDRGRDLELGAGDHERLGEARADLRRHALGRDERIVVQVGEQDQEAVPAGAGEQVRGAERLPQPRGQEPQQLVAGAVAEGVVDQLEVIEVDVQQCDLRAGAPGAGERQLELLREQRAVGQPGERVVIGEVGDLLLGGAALGDVLARGQRAGDHAVGIAQDGVVPGDRAQLAALRQDRALEMLDERQRASDQLVEAAAEHGALVIGDGEREPVRAEDLLLGALEDGAALAVDQQHLALGVEHNDHRPGDVEVALRPVALGAQHHLRAVVLVRLEAAPLEVLGELPADGGEHRRDEGVGLLDRVGVELEHAGAVVGERDRERDRGRQAGAQRVGLARHDPVRRHVGHPGRAAERIGAARQAAAGGDLEQA